MNKFRTLLNVSGMITLYSLLVFYISWNGWIWLKTAFSIEYPLLYAILMIIISYSYLISQFLKSITIFKVIGSFWFAVFQYCLLLLPIANLFVWLVGFTSIPKDALIIWAGWFVLLTIGLILGFGLYNAYSPTIRAYQIAIPKKGSHRKSLRIAMASDMHFGVLSGRKHVQRLVHLVNRLVPDIILLPGDIIDDDPQSFIKQKMGDLMKKLKAPLGTYGVLGNHEYYGGEIPQYLKEMNEIDIKILLDEVMTIDNSFFIIGRKDKTDKNRKSVEELVGNLNQDLPVILMDHQPSELNQAMNSGVDVILSGHTHRGQMAPNHLVTKKLFELDWGYKKKKQLHAFVSSGFGFWGPPIRIGSRSEILQIDITFV
ncbi:metallophosphoesterase [Bacillus sp. 03113]|uniref:metallophosphoesterase n=1 Tax=Bacillus sp. 03113 TaxID=2578211 RepID=UPI001144A0F0|nr:metallophosphoesterase [Bacillus sp. 03113]